MTWTDGELGDFLTLKRGHDLPNDSRKAGDIPVVSSSGFTGWHDEAKAEPPGVVTGRCGTIGEVFYVDQPYWPLNTALYVIDFKGNDPRFIAYFLRHHLRNYQSEKSAVPSVDRKVLHKLAARCPDTQIQQAIVRNLSAYDDLIENNRRRIALLEEAARQIYKEWFVRFRFPGHEHVEVTDGVPAGWERMDLADCVDVVKDAADPKLLDPNTPYIGLEHLPRRSITLSEWGTAEMVESGKFRFKSKDILFGKIRPYFHKVGFSLIDGITSSDAIVMRPKEDVNWAYILMEVSSDRFVALASQTVKEGSKMPRANWDVLKKHAVIMPPDSLKQIFGDYIGEITSQTKALSLANSQAAKARDLLLPRLMSGAIPV